MHRNQVMVAGSWERWPGAHKGTGGATHCAPRWRPPPSVFLVPQGNASYQGTVRM